jgi:hypothetical protein
MERAEQKRPVGSVNCGVRAPGGQHKERKTGSLGGAGLVTSTGVPYSMEKMGKEDGLRGEEEGRVTCSKSWWV